MKIQKGYRLSEISYQRIRISRTFLSLVVIAFAMLASAGYGQQTESPVGRKISEKIRDSEPEKMYIHLDRPTYLVGETIWFKMLVTDEHLRLKGMSTIGYLEVISSGQQPVVQAKVELRNGKGSGSVQIPPDAPTGHYLVRGYTSWMKNFPATHVFETNVVVVNPFVPGFESEEEGSVASSTPDLQFFAEGGGVVMGIENKIAFRAQGSDGTGLKFNGRILTRSGTVVATFAPLVHGIGHFLFTPVNGETYTAEITDTSGNKYSFPFEILQKKGYAVRLYDQEDHLKIAVNSGNSDENNIIHLLIYNGDKSVAFQATSTAGKTGFEVPKSKLKPGVNVLTFFNRDLKPVAERLYFQKITVPPLTVSIGKRDLGKREKLSLSIAPGTIRDSLEASVAVYLSDSLPEPDQTPINAYLLLTSELKGRIENPEYYFQEGNAEVTQALDNLMLTHGWRRFQKNGLPDADFSPEYIPELDGPIITGRITSADGGRMLSNRPVFAAYPSMKINPWVALSDEKGRFVLETRKFSGRKELVVQTNYRMDTTAKIEIDNPFLPTGEIAPKLPARPLSSLSQHDILKRSINMQVQNSYFPPKKVTPAPDSTAFYGRPDFRYYLDEFTRFPTMEEVLSEYVPAVMIRLRKGKYYTRVVETGVHTQVFSEDPLLLMDGIPVFDTDRIIHFDPLKVQKADVVNRMYYLGPLTFPGIVSYSTYTHDLSGFEVDPKALILAYDGTLEKREFYSPIYDKKIKNGHRLPDFRNLLYWSPSFTVKPGEEKKLDFYTSDQTGRYKIVLQALSVNGAPLSATSQFIVTD